MLSKNQQKFISSLSLKKNRDESQLFVVEGVKPVDELLNSGWEIQSIYGLTEWFTDSRVQKLEKRAIEYLSISVNDLDKITQMRTANQVVAIARMKKQVTVDLKKGFYIVLDNINDPGNLGTIIRIADWFGLSGVICSTNTADCYNPKVVQSTMGSLFRVPIRYEPLTECIEIAKKQGVPIYLADMNGKSINEVSFKPNGLLIMGSESHGIQSSLVSQSGGTVITIPKIGNAESLNVGVAAGIICARVFQ